VRPPDWRVLMLTHGTCGRELGATRGRMALSSASVRHNDWRSHFMGNPGGIVRRGGQGRLDGYGDPGKHAADLMRAQGSDRMGPV
jgi:hypothetical protein